MPKIQEYTPETEASGPVGGVSPNIEEATMFGRGVESFGKNISESVDLLQRRQTQSEISDAYAATAEGRVQFMQQIKAGVDNGTLDTDKFKESYQNWVDQQSENYSTPGAKNYFNRQANRVAGSLLMTAMRGQALIAHNNAKANLDKGLSAQEMALEQDPTMFPDTHDGMIENINHQVDAGGLPAAEKEKMQTYMGAKLASAAIRGYYRSNPDDAQHMLDQGAFDEYLNSDQKKALYSEVKTARAAKDVEDERVNKIAKEAQKAQQQTWEQDALPKLIGNGLSTKDVLSAPGTAEDKLRWINLIKQQSKEELKTDPKVRNDIYSRMLLPDNDPRKISDPSQLMDQAAKGHIAPGDIKQFQTFLDNTPEGKALNENRRQLNQMAKDTLVKPAIPGLKDPDGDYKLMQFTNALHQAENERRQQKLPIKDLYDVNSPAFFGKQLEQYRSTPSEIIQAQANQIRGGMVTPQVIQKSIGVAPTPDKLPSNGAPKRNAGESPADFLKRIKGK